jgi:pimeloyl-ACP methyl ester carboxylesterase
MVAQNAKKCNVGYKTILRAIPGRAILTGSEQLPILTAILGKEEAMKIEANGISMNYEVTGSGRWLTLIHGAGDNLEAWWNQVPAFSERYRVLTYDVRGYGQTETPAGEYTTDILVQDLNELLKGLGIEETYLLGYSMGGRIAVEFTLKYPGTVKALIIANSGVAPVERGQADMKEMMELRQKRMETVEKEGLAPIMGESTAMVFSPGWPEKNLDVVEHYTRIRLKNDPGAYLTAMRAMVWGMSPPDVSAIRCPTLIIAGEKDGLMGAESGQASQKLIPGSQLKVMATGHAAAIEKPEEFNSTVLEFLAGTGK